MTTIEISDCGNIAKAELQIQDGATTVLFGMNGTGKSTLAEALFRAMDKSGKFDDLKPYGSLAEPSVNLVVGCLNNPLVFNESYVENVLYKGDAELIDGGYRVFVENADYKAAVERTEQIIDGASHRLNGEGELGELIATVSELLECYGKAKDGYAANSSLGRSVATKGDLIENVPPELRMFSPLIQSETGKSWIQWHKSGASYNRFGVCPYCGVDLRPDAIDRCESLQQTYGSKYLDHCSKVFQAFGRAEKCLSETARQAVDKAIHGCLTGDGPTAEVEGLYKGIKADAEALRNKLTVIGKLSYATLKSSKDYAKHLSNLKIDIDLIDKMKSDYVREKVSAINAVIDDLISNVKSLQKAVGEQSTALRKSFLTV